MEEIETFRMRGEEEKVKGDTEEERKEKGRGEQTQGRR